MNLKNKRNKVFLVIFLLISVIIIGHFFNLPRTKKVKANTLLIEGWISDDALHFAYNEFKNKQYKYLITTGLKLPDYYILSRNGSLIFYPNFIHKNNKIGNKHVFKINMYSDLGENDKAHANLYINNNKVDSFYVETRKKSYRVTWNGCLSEIDSIIIEYDNNCMGELGDRNLWVKDILIDDTIAFSYNNSVHEIHMRKGNVRIKNNFYTYADNAKNKLISAVECRNWIKNSKLKINGINIISQGIHCKRTFYTYRKIFKNSTNIGIIEAPDYKSFYSLRYKLKKLTAEIIKFYFYSLALVFY